MTDGFKVGTGLKQGDRLAPNLFNSTGICNKAIVSTNHINNISYIIAINWIRRRYKHHG